MRRTKDGLKLKPLVSALLALGLACPGAGTAAPQGGVLAGGSAVVSQQGTTTLVQQSSDRAIINWRNFDIGRDEAVRFIQPSAQSTTLNRVTGPQASFLLGRLDANGQVILVNPNGILIGAGAQLNVGSLIASTSNIEDKRFLEGRLLFDQPGNAGAGITNAGRITAAEGGLVALVAPHVRNDGVIEARLGKVLIGAADTFTIDLYGDGLINLSLGEQHRGKLHSADGRPVDYLINQSGQIYTDGGKTLLISAANAGAVLDNLINMTGTIRAEKVAEVAGRIVLTGANGEVDVSGQLTANGETGGRIEVLGDRVHLAGTALLDASGTYGGGVIHVGGDWQGSGNTLRATGTTIDAGAAISVRALQSGNGGEVVIWSDGRTAFAGGIDARGGLAGGNGGRVEVSGREVLEFNGLVDAGAANGAAGFLLLDPAIMNIGLAEAALIDRVLRTGTSTTVTADTDINVNSLIDGRGRYQGGGLSLIAGNNINLNDFVVTANGALNFVAGSGILNIAAGKGAFAGTAPINVTTGGDLSLANLFTTGSLTARSTGGRLIVAQGIDGFTGAVALRAAQELTVNAPIVNFLNGSSLNLSSDAGDIVVNAQIDGRGGTTSGPVTLTAGQNIHLNESIVSQNGAISLNALAGTVTPAGGKGLFAGSGPISVTTGGNLLSGIYNTTGLLSLRSTGGSLTLGEKIAETMGNVSLRAAGDVNIDQGIANIRNGSSLTVQADSGDINVNARIDAQDAGSGAPVVAGGTVTLTAGNNVNINETIVTNNGAVAVTATNGTVVFSNAGTDGSGNKKIMTGLAPITVTTGGNFSTGTAPPAGLVFNMGPSASDPPSEADVNDFIAEQLKPWVTMATTGKLTLVSTGGNISIDAPIPQTTGELEIRAGNNVVVNDKLVNAVNSPITIVAGTACTPATCPDPSTKGKITVNNSNTDTNITVHYEFGGATKNAPHGISPEVDARAANLTMTAFGNIDINAAVASTATLRITSTNGFINKGTIGNSRFGGVRPQNLYLDGALGIGTSGLVFNAGRADLIDARSASGSIYLFVEGPGRLDVTAGVDAVLSGELGAIPTLNAGRDVDVRASGVAGQLSMTAGRDVLVKNLAATSIDANAGRDVSFHVNTGGIYATDASIWLTGGGLSVTAGQDILFTGDTGVSIRNLVGGVLTGAQPAFTLVAGRNVELRRLQTWGAVSISADQSITLYNDIGPVITNPVDFTPDQGVASLVLQTLPAGSINMQGARAVGNIDITTGSLTAAKAISVGGGSTRNITAPTLLLLNDGVPIGSMDEMIYHPPVAPSIPPGPMVNAPPPPAALNALAAGAPGGLSVAGSSAPAGSGDLEEIPLLPEKTVTTPTVVASASTAQGTEEASAPPVFELPTSSIAQMLDFGRSGSFSPLPPAGEGGEEGRRSLP